jgi:hypothetical protein
MNSAVESSFRDPSGSLFYHDDKLYRRINLSYKDNYEYLISSGLYEDLRKERMIVSHEETSDVLLEDEGFYKVIRPEKLPFISYPYEWCFSQLKDAALLTLRIQKKAIEYGMTLKDSSAYNVQFYEGKPVLIDTLSFEIYKEGEPWIAYRQFCQHFLAPLTLMSYKDVRLSELLKAYIDGIPLDLASRLLPIRTYSRFSLLSHIHIHAKSQTYYSEKNVVKNNRKISRQSLLGLVDNLESSVLSLKWNPKESAWSRYYQNNTYTETGIKHKTVLIENYLDEIQPRLVWDLGANTGLFSRLAAKKNIHTISFDIDHECVEINYREVVRKGEKNILPLIMDVASPSPGIGWSNKERLQLAQRGPADMVLALALIHHLAISNNIPLQKIASFFQSICNHLIIEFVPKTDTQVKRLLNMRKDIFHNYTREEFEKEFSNYFSIIGENKLEDSERVLYLMLKKN